MTTATETEVQQLRRELAEMRERLDAGKGEPDDSLAVARREIEAQYFNATPSIMDAPCQHMNVDGSMCGRSWKLDNDTIRPIHIPTIKGSHSYRPKPLEQVDEPMPAEYKAKGTISAREAVEYGVNISEVLPQTMAEAWMDEATARKALSMTLKELRVLLKASPTMAIKVGTVVLVSRQAVERLIALADAARDAGEDPDEEA